MSAEKLQELEDLADELLVTARALPPGENRQNALELIGKYRLQISALKNARLSKTSKAKRRITSLIGLVAILLSTGAFAQSAPPKVGKKPLLLVKPKAPMGCKLIGTVKGTKIWAGDCAGAAELKGAAPAGEPAPARPAVAPTDKQ